MVQTFAGLHWARMVDENLRLQHTDVSGERNQDFPTTGTVDGSEILLAPVDVLVVYLPLFRVYFVLHSQGGWPWDFWLPSIV